MMACCPTTGDAELQENWHSPDTAQVDQEDEGKGVTEEDLNGELPSLAATVIDESKLQNDDVDCVSYKQLLLSQLWKLILKNLSHRA